MWIYIVGVWLSAGVIKVALTDGWIIMISDKNNVRATWAAIPVMILAWILWPLNVGEWAFKTILRHEAGRAMRARHRSSI